MTRALRYIAVVGSRNATREDVLRAFHEHKLTPQHHVIVSGGARGADTWARNIACEWGFQYVDVPAFWERGKHAGFSRNSTIVDLCDAVIAVWDGVSTGTMDTINKAEKAGKKVAIVEMAVPDE